MVKKTLRDLLEDQELNKTSPQSEFSLLDEMFNNEGLLSGLIYEIGGVPGIGKTTLCYQYAVSVLLDNQCNAVLFIDTRCNFDARRLLSIIENHPKKGEQSASELLQRIHVIRSSNVFDLISLVVQVEAYSNSLHPLKLRLLIIDGINTPLRSPVWLKVSDHCEAIRQVGCLLLKIAHICSVPVLVTNQLTTKFAFNNENQINQRVRLVPALGETWTTFVHHRLILYWHGDERVIWLLRSSWYPLKKLQFNIKVPVVLRFTNF